MRRIYILALLLCLYATAWAQKLDPSYYDFPLRDVAGYYSANFGEMRPNHFHSGTDFKTNGVEGKPVIAVADGYVSRILQSPTGYGLALYVVHPNGTTSVYGHLSRFRKDIADYVFAERHRLKQSRVDLYCKAGQFTVKRGEEIARSGNTGSSQGPHLHFEIRDSRTGKTFNIIKQGIVTPKDDISPYIMKVHYIEVDTVRGVPVHSRPATYAVHKADNTTYRTAQQSPIKVGRNGYFVVETSDRKNDVANTYGVYNLEEKIDGKTIFEYRNDGFTFDLSRYCNAVSYYPIQRSSRNEAMRTALLQGGTKYFYPTLVNRGVVTTSAEQKRDVEFLITDDCGNTSTLKFQIVGKADADCFKGEIDEGAYIVEYNHDFADKVDDVLSVVIPKGALYESIAMKMGRSDVEIKADSTVSVLSPAYTIHDADTPLQTSIGVVFSMPIEEALQPYTTMASVAANGRLSYVGGTYRNRRFTARTSTFGTFCLVADRTAPVIRPQFTDGQDCRSRNSISFRLSDNFSGVSTYTATIDGQWVAIDYARSRATINLAAEGITGGKSHTVQITVKDSCGNTATWQGTIIR
ncbi:MAG: M23 family metallopeptidase [Alistipes sp.]|nr:M23 family metallopeptidase [Alistipes sp.]